MRNKADNKRMELQGDYFTLREIAGILGESTNTIKKRILRLDIKATVRDALYTSSDLEKIKAVKMGRPKKAPENNAGKKPPVETKKKPDTKKQGRAKK